MLLVRPHPLRALPLALLLFVPVGARALPCVVGCDDGDPCTVDTCDALGGCRHEPLACDDTNSCTVDACEDGACRHRPLDGVACESDGVACTADVCGGGTCLHVPLDDRCRGTDACAIALCAPDAAETDERGCVLETGSTEDTTCTEDGLPCTDDRCRNGTCTHVPVADYGTCEPVTTAFRTALSLESTARGLSGTATAVLGGGAVADRPARLRSVDRIDRIAESLAAAAGVLGGRPETVASPADDASSTPAKRRAEAALPVAVRASLDAAALVLDLRRASRDAGLDRTNRRDLRRRARTLRRGTRKLARELRRLRRFSQTFVR